MSDMFQPDEASFTAIPWCSKLPNAIFKAKETVTRWLARDSMSQTPRHDEITGHRRKLRVNVVSDMFQLEEASFIVMPWCSKLLSAIFKATETLGGAPVIL